MRRVFCHLILISLALSDVRAPWPPSVPSSVELLGLFQDDWNSSTTATDSTQCRAMFKAAVSLAEAYNITIGGRPIGWRVAQTSDDIITTMEHTCLTVSETNVVGIVGPRLSREAHVISRFAQRIGIPVVSYSATDPDLSDRQTHPAFYRTIPSDASAAEAIVKLFERYNWTSCILIYQNDAFGSAGAQVLGETFEQREMSIAETIVFDVSTQTIRSNLTSRLSNSATRVIVLWADSTFTANILQEAAMKNLLGPRYLWILSDGVALARINKAPSHALIGLVSVEPVSSSEINATNNASLLRVACEMWKRYEPESFPEGCKVHPYAMFTFDATWLLIQSLQQLCWYDTDDPSRPCLSFGNSSYCFDRELINSSALLHQISTMKFLGVSGPIEFDVHGADRTRGIHYIAANVQSSPMGLTFVPVLKYTETKEWQRLQATHDMVWPGSFSEVPSERATISGVTLRIGLIESRPFTMIDEHRQNRSRPTGYIPDLIELLRKRMNFTPELRMAPYSVRHPELFQAVAKGDYDMIVADIIATSDRRELVAFSASIYDYSLRLIVRKPTVEQVELFAYLRPFSLSLWMVILSTMLCTSVLFFLAEGNDNEALRDRSTASMGAMSVWYSIGHIMGYGADFHATTISGRILTVALYILSLVLVASYTANLASNLTISRTKSIISSIDDIKQLKLPFNRIGIRPETLEEEFFLREISEESRSYYPLKSRDEIFNRLLNGDIDASFIDGPTGEYMTNTVYCNLTLVGPEFDARRLGIVAPKHWLYLEDFDRNVLALRELGYLNTLRKRWFESNVCQDSVETPNAMSVESMAGLFLTVGVMVVIALIALVWTKRMAIKNYLQRMKGQQEIVGRDADVVTRPPH